MKDFKIGIILSILLLAALKGNDLPDSSGITAYPDFNSIYRITNNNAIQLDPDYKIKHSLEKLSSKIDGYVRESINLNKWIPAQDYIICKFNNETKSIELLNPNNEDILTQKSTEAIDKAPAWLINPLINTLSKLDSTHQNKWADIILESQYPYIDEIAFCVAYSSPAYLKSKYSFPELFIENAATIYANDEELDYVEIVDFGSGSGNYYSTTKYKIVQKTVAHGQVIIDTSTIEIPFMTYYWYIVHPKISDEIPSYINPNALEYNHRDNIDKNGHFWRTYFFNHNDNGYVKLKDLLKNVQIAWDNNTGEGPVNAMQRLNIWISNSIPEFGSNNERPHQPIRIYTKHLGRCGEFSDMRTAAARTALVPCTNVGSLSTDHVWNEFYLGRWVHWDNDIDSPQMYENGWGKVFGSVYERRSDGKITTITSRYSDICQIDIAVTDNIGNAIDGAVVKLYMYNDELYPNYLQRSDNYGLTDSEGKITFRVGENRKYYVRVITDFGVFPSAGEMELLVDQTQKYTNYNFTLPVNTQLDTTTFENSFLEMNDRRYFFNVNLEILNEVINGPVWYDDIGSDARFFYKALNKENIELFLVNDLNELQDRSTIRSFHQTTGSFIRNYSIPIIENEDQYLVIANLRNHVNLQSIEAKIELIDTNTKNPKHIALGQNYPNPFNNHTKIPFTSQETALVTIEIFNILGQKVNSLETVSGSTLNNYVIWEGTSETGDLMPTGIYFYKLKGMNNHYKPMLLLK